MKDAFGKTVSEWDDVGALCIAQKHSASLTLLHYQHTLIKGSSTLIPSVVQGLESAIPVKQLE